ncbi:DUF948 domain-containing protein [Virgibacillus doumboii]|uniref:DUF948 domain-containing protein n=1 Tax=Virgibacillus doumboii TaxID=2697503 RepID=UPI0013DF719C|nr:DUF948 domain-containing protein [Virgibacillus doumboii]
MDWLGIGVLIIGLALLGLVVLLVKPLKNLTSVIASLQKTTDPLPQQIADVTGTLKSTLSNVNDTLHSVNKQMNRLGPILAIVGNIMETAGKLSSTLVNISGDMSDKAEKDSVVKQKNLEWIYGAAALGYCIFQRKK